MPVIPRGFLSFVARNRDRRSNPSTKQQGYALLLMLVMVTMGLLFTVVSQVSLVGMRVAQTQGDNGVLLQAKEALIGYAASYRDTHTGQVFGYLPCPDTNGDGNADITCGSAETTSQPNIAAGLLPYETLGLKDLRDRSGTCLWYVVSGSFKNNPKSIAQLMNWDTQGNITVLDANGNTIAAPNDVNGGAAAVIIAAGPPLAGQNRTPDTNSTHICGVMPAQVSAYLDGINSGLTTITQGVTAQNDPRSSIDNDQVIAITPNDIFNRIVARADFSYPLTGNPVGQINKLGDDIRAVLEYSIQNDMTAGTTTTANSNTVLNYTQSGTLNASTFVGSPATNSTTGITKPNSSWSGDSNYLSEWNDQYRQAICNNLNTPCLTIAGSTCRGGLFFSGRGTVSATDLTPKPRTSSDKSALPPTLTNYFENIATGAYALLTGGNVFSGGTSYSPASPSSDIGICLFPGSFVSFAQNIGDFASGTTNAGANTVAAVNTAAQSVSLGSSVSGAASGCAWDVNALPLGSSLRLYFRLNFTTKGDGFTLALADGATNLPPNNTSRTQIMCGAANSASLGYAGVPPSGSSAGIKSPKLGIEFDTHFDAGTKDPAADHMAFQYWGDPVDNAIGGSGNDDNYHYFGTGGQAVTGATCNAGTVTLTTAAPHGLSVGQVVLVSGISPVGYNGTYAVTAAGTTTLGYTLPTCPGSFTTAGMVKPSDWGNGGAPISGALWSIPISAASWAGGAVTITTTGPHGFSSGQTVTLSSVAPAAYNGAYVVTVTGANSFTYSLASNPGTYAAGGMASSGTSAIPAGSYNGGTATFTTNAAHGFVAGQTVLVTGISPSAYTGLFPILASGLTSTQFSVSLTTNPGTYVGGGYAGPIAPRNPRVATALRSIQINSASWSNGIATIRTSGQHHLVSKNTIYISGVSPSTYNGFFQITRINNRTFTVPLPLLSNPGIGSGGNVVEGAEISSLSWLLNKATATVTGTNGFYSSSSGLPSPPPAVTIFGVTPAVTSAGGMSGFDVASVSLSSALTSSLTYPLFSNPGGSFSTETPAGMALVKSNDAHLPYSTLPASIPVYVRLDISRNYDSTNHIAVLNMKAYVGDFSHFPTNDNCGTDATNYQNLARDFASICPSRAPTLQQDSIPISALANISGVSWLGGIATITTSAPHGLVPRASITISDANPSTFNGTYTVESAPTSTQFSINMSNDPGYQSGGDIQPLSTIYVGFINARGATSSEDQNLTIDQLILRTQ